MITMAAGNASQNHNVTKPDNSSSGIFHREQTQKRRPMSVSGEPLDRLEICKKEQQRMQSFRDKVPANASPKPNSHFNVKNEKDGHVGSSQLLTTALLPNQSTISKQNVPREGGKPYQVGTEGDVSKPHTFRSIRNSPSGTSSKHFVYYDEIAQPDVTEEYDEENSIGRAYPVTTYDPREFEKRRCSECGSEKESEDERSSCDCANCCQCRRIVINISGQIFETQLRTLEKFPQTLLGDPDKRKKYYDPSRDQYFFDRDRMSFDGILNYYQSNGRIRRPLSVSIDVFGDEIKFFQLGIEAMSTYQDVEGYEFSDDDMDSIDNGKIKKQEKKEKLPANKLQREIWLLFEKPESSNAARVVAIVSISVIFLSIICFCVETLPTFQEMYNNAASNITTENKTNNHETGWPAFVTNPFWIIETFCIVWFTIELASRFLSCPRKSRFWLDILNVIDLVAIIPYFVSTGSAAADHARGRHSSGNKGVSLAFFRVVRLVRVFRIFKLSRHSVGLQILAKTLKSSGSELGLLLFFVLIGVITFSSAVYFAEIDSEESDFDSIPDAFWWAIVTMTTVGYGDMYPKTLAGKVIGSICALCGILCLALPVPVIVSNFMYFYRRAKLKQRTESGL